MSQPISLSMAQIIAPGSALFNFAAQIYGITIADPNMKVISDKRVGAFSPAPAMIGIFFSMQQVLQLYWLSRFFRSDTKNDKEALRYAPFYALGNAMIGLWMFAWCSERMTLALAFVTVNSVAQLLYVYTMMPASTRDNRATRLVAQTFAGIGVLDLIHSFSIAAYEGMSPNTLTKTLTAILFPLTAFLSSPVMGACLAYDALGVALGQRVYDLGGTGWTTLMFVTAATTAAAVAAKVGMNWYV